MEDFKEKVFELNKKECFEYVEGFSSRSKFMRSMVQDFDFLVGYHGTNINKKKKSYSS